MRGKLKPVQEGAPAAVEATAPAPAAEAVAKPDAAIVGDASPKQDAEKVYTYAHGDGQEFSGTLEQARKVCDALGRMSVTNARESLQQADLAARITQRGREKRLAETAKAPEVKEHLHKSDLPKKAAQTPDKKQTPQDVASKVLAEKVATADVQTAQAVEVKSQLDSLVDPVKDIRPKQSAQEAHAAVDAVPKELVKAAVPEEVQPAEPAQEAASPYPVAAVAEIAEITQRAEDHAGQIEQQAEPVLRISEVAVQPIDQEPAADTLAGITPDKTIQEEDFSDAAQEAAAVPFEELSLIQIEEPSEPVLEVLNVVEVAEPGDVQESLMEYDLLGEDDAMLLTAEFEKNNAVADENPVPVLAEAVLAELDEAEVLRFGPMESQTVISVPELPAPVEEIEIAITQLVEVLELSEPEEPTRAYQILEAIITLPASLETTTDETEETMGQKLEELFVELFETAGIAHTPQLTQSFIKLTQAHYLEALLEPASEEEQELPDEIGTREFLQKLQHGLSKMKRAVVHFYEIGKSIMKLYSLEIFSQNTLALH